MIRIHALILVFLILGSTPRFTRREPPTPPPVVEEAEEEPPEPVLTYLGQYRVVGYNYTDAAQCGKAVADGITASGEPAVHGRTAAADMPFGTVLYIVGYGEVVINDRGVSGKTIDIAFSDNESCFAVTGKYEVYLVEG